MVSGRLYDGRSARAETLMLYLDSASRLVSEPRLFEPVPFKKVRIASRIGNTPRVFTLPSGEVIELDAHEAVEEWCHRAGIRSGLAHVLERRLSIALGSLVLVAAILAAGAIWGVPWAARHLAHALPDQVITKLGQGTLDTLDRALFSPSELDAKTRSVIENMLSDLLPENQGAIVYRIEFRSGGLLGANAFALPDGTLVLTDEFIQLAETDGQIAAVLLHEIGHVVHRHGLRRVIAHTGLAALTVAVFGDVTAAGTLVLALPNLLMESAYSREMESEADMYALDQMDKLGIARVHFADILDLLAKSHRETQRDSDNFGRYLSSHPATDERIERILSTDD